MATDDFKVTLRAAYKSGDDVFGADIKGDTMTAGFGLGYQNAYFGVLYGEDDADTAALDAEEIRYYVSYKIPAVMGADNFAIYLGASYAEGEVNGVDKDDVVGGKVRLKYIF